MVPRTLPEPVIDQEPQGPSGFILETLLKKIQAWELVYPLRAVLVIRTIQGLHVLRESRLISAQRRTNVGGRWDIKQDGKGQRYRGRDTPEAWGAEAAKGGQGMIRESRHNVQPASTRMQGRRQAG